MQAQHTNRAQEIETEAFENFEKGLTHLLAVEKSTFESYLEALKLLYSEQQKLLRVRIATETTRVLWLLRVPFLMIVLASLLTVGVLLTWFRIQDLHRVRMSPWKDNGKSYLIVDDPTWSKCLMGKIQGPPPSKTTTVVLQPCKPVE
jgi:hypothetical protein